MPYGKKTVKVNLAGEDEHGNSGYWVRVRTSLTLGEQEELAQYKDADGMEAARHMLSRAITDWNVDGEDGQVLPITPETVKALVNDDVLTLFQLITPKPRTVEEQKVFTEPSSAGAGETDHRQQDSNGLVSNSSSGAISD